MLYTTTSSVHFYTTIPTHVLLVAVRALSGCVSSLPKTISTLVIENKSLKNTWQQSVQHTLEDQSFNLTGKSCWDIYSSGSLCCLYFYVCYLLIPLKFWVRRENVIYELLGAFWLITSDFSHYLSSLTRPSHQGMHERITFCSHI